MIATPIESRNGIAYCEGIQQVLSRYCTELEWLAYFLTHDLMVARACVADACRLSLAKNHIFEESLLQWTRRATIRTAIELLGSRMSPSCSAHEANFCAHRKHLPLREDEVEVVVLEQNVLVRRLDVLCRCALVLCGIERHTANEAAALLGVSVSAVHGAYCAALQHLEVARFEGWRSMSPAAAVCN